MNRIRVGLAGLGRAGWNLHRAALLKHPSMFEITAVADVDRARAAEAAIQLRCTGFPSVGELAGSDVVDLVVLCVPSSLHAGLATAALERGKHVLVEKPISTTVAELETMIAAASRAGRRLLGSQNRRYAADFLVVREVVDSGCLGDLHEIKVVSRSFRRRWDWQTVARLGGGALLNDGSHVIDQALALGGPAERECWGEVRRTSLALGDAEDHVKVVMKAPGEPVVEAEISYASAFPVPMWTVSGAYGALTGDGRTIRWKYLDPASLAARDVIAGSPAARDYDQESYVWTEAERDVFEDYVRSHERMYVDVYSALADGAPSDLDAPNLLGLVGVLDQLRQHSDVQRTEPG